MKIILISLFMMFYFSTSAQLNPAIANSLDPGTSPIPNMPIPAPNIPQDGFTQCCNVRYKKENGWSDYYLVQVRFESGISLNNKTKTNNYDGWTIYGVIFWKQDESSVIELSGYSSLAGVSFYSLPSYSEFYGTDLRGNKWGLKYSSCK